jgi:small ligand-binding sensory domain FIST
VNTSSATTGAMRWASAFSATVDSRAAAREACEVLGHTLGAGPVDVVAMFFTGRHVAGVEAIAETVRLRLRPGTLIGASAHGVVSSGHEIESGAALTLLAGRLPGVQVAPFVLATEGWAEAHRDSQAFARAAPGAAGAALVLLLGDPFSLDTDSVLAAFNRHAPGVPVVGGLASAAAKPHGNALLLNDWRSDEGGVAVALSGALRVDIVVSQGCRPIGPPLTVTRAEGNVIVQMDHQPAVERAEQVLRTLPAVERERLRHGLYVGRPARGGASGRGDWVIRNLLGADRDRGAIAVGDLIVEGEVVRLHVRDADIARDDLAMLLSPQMVESPAGAALLFACNGRGRAFYGAPDGDIAPLQASLGGGVPAAGMFCAGEIGPVAGRNFLHGHTASIAIVRPGAGT